MGVGAPCGYISLVSAITLAIADSTAAPSPGRAALLGLKLTNFRNYSNLTLELDARPVVLLGPNGAGKTNLLEAVSFLSPGRGLRRAKLDSVARLSGDGSWAVAARIAAAAGPVEIGTGLTLGLDGPERSRRVLVNHAPVRSSEALLEHLRVLWLTPSMDGIFTGPSSERRRFLDRLVLTIDRRHGERVNAFERAMRGRNRLLEVSVPDGAWLNAIETEMAEIATAIAAARVEAVNMLSRLIATSGAEPFPAASLVLDGSLEAVLANSPATVAEDGYRAQLAASRRMDSAAGRTLAGPHLTDLRVGHAPKAAPAEICSTGEQKALLIGLVLAHARLAAALTGETPIVLLDEIAAHLDSDRRGALFAALLALGAQTWMTGTDAGGFAQLGSAAQFLEIDEGRAVQLRS